MVRHVAATAKALRALDTSELVSVKNAYNHLLHQSTQIRNEMMARTDQNQDSIVTLYESFAQQSKKFSENVYTMLMRSDEAKQKAEYAVTLATQVADFVSALDEFFRKVKHGQLLWNLNVQTWAKSQNEQVAEVQEKVRQLTVATTSKNDQIDQLSKELVDIRQELNDKKREVQLLNDRMSIDGEPVGRSYSPTVI